MRGDQRGIQIDHQRMLCADLVIEGVVPGKLLHPGLGDCSGAVDRRSRGGWPSTRRSTGTHLGRRRPGRTSPAQPATARYRPGNHRRDVGWLGVPGHRDRPALPRAGRLGFGHPHADVSGHRGAVNGAAAPSARRRCSSSAAIGARSAKAAKLRISRRGSR